MKKTVDNRVSGWYNNQRRQGRHTSFGGLAQLGERLHGMQEVSGSIPLFSTKKAPYFAGSTVLFFLLKMVFEGCVASPAPFFKKEYLPPGCSADSCIIPLNVRRKVEVERNIELICQAQELNRSSSIYGALSGGAPFYFLPAF